jgi:Sulfotransferase domain
LSGEQDAVRRDVRGVATALPSEPRAASQTVPDFFIVGHPKCGTTALYEMLRDHPQLYMPECKEPWFLASELHVRTPPRPEGTPATLEQYLSLFDAAAPGQRVGEATPHYLWSRTAAAAIAELQPAARIIALLREPASFLHSLHLQFLETYVETENDLRKALALEPERREGRRIPRYTYWPAGLMYSEHVRYVEQLQRYYSLFPAEQILVLVYDDFRRDNEATVRAVQRFLGVDDSAPVRTAEVNPTVRPRSQLLHELVHAVGVGRGPASRAVRSAVKALTPDGLRRRALYATRRRVVFAAPAPPDERLTAELRGRFKSEVVSLSEFLGRDLVTLWGYDRVL